VIWRPWVELIETASLLAGVRLAYIYPP